MNFTTLLSGKRLVRHILFWVAYVLINAFAWGFADNNNFINQLVNEIWLLPVKLAIVYFNLYYLVPYFLLRKKKLYYFSLLIICYLAGTLLMRWTYVNFILKPGDAEILQEPFFKPYRLFKYFLFDINFAVIITTIIKLFSYWYTQEQAAQEMKEQKHLAEIQLLKSQVNPHFLFNTLNNLYSLTLHTSKKAPEMVLRLSDIMRYMIYEGAQERVLLKDEISYLRDYLAIETIRYGDELKFSFEVEGEPGHLMIAPLLLIPFIENIFKHSIEKDPESAVASVLISIKNNQLTCLFKNNKAEKVIYPGNPRSGLGINNVIKRLQLIYPGQHAIKIEGREDFFVVELQITLANKNPL